MQTLLIEDNKEYKPNPQLAKVLDVLFIVRVEQKMNCSTADVKRLALSVYQTCLRMDGLEVFNNSFNGESSGTLYKLLIHCITASGKLLLRRWICHPLKDVNAINGRLDIVEAFIQNCGVDSGTLKFLQKIPDLERLLGQVRSTLGPDLERLLGQVRSTMGLTSAAMLPFVQERILKGRKIFGTLIKGLRVGIDLLILLQRGDHGISALSKFMSVDIPTLSSLDELVCDFEDAMRHQDCDIKVCDVDDLCILVKIFVGKASEWSLVINAISAVDVLRSFAAMKSSSSGTMCRPHILLKDKVTILRMKGLWHPYAFTESATGIVPNDLSLGQDLFGQNRFALLLTGPSMGGKSTIMRATCLAVLLAQLGCYVPCTSCEFTVFDSIYTCVGATDRIMHGESRFLVDCTETASVLQNATEDSLVWLDELGTGTSPSDGYLIAYAVFRHLVEQVRCRLLFATHYRALTKDFTAHPHVSLQHMASMFRPRSGGTGGKELTFLYRLVPGAPQESYGLQVATVAGIPMSIVEKASVVAEGRGRAQFPTSHKERLRMILTIGGAKDARLHDDTMLTAGLCVAAELKSHFRKGGI